MNYLYLCPENTPFIIYSSLVILKNLWFHATSAFEVFSLYLFNVFSTLLHLYDDFSTFFSFMFHFNDASNDFVRVLCMHMNFACSVVTITFGEHSRSFLHPFPFTHTHKQWLSGDINVSTCEKDVESIARLEFCSRHQANFYANHLPIRSPDASLLHGCCNQCSYIEVSPFQRFSSHPFTFFPCYSHLFITKRTISFLWFSLQRCHGRHGFVCCKLREKNNESRDKLDNSIFIVHCCCCFPLFYHIDFVLFTFVLSINCETDTCITERYFRLAYPITSHVRNIGGVISFISKRGSRSINYACSGHGI